MKRAVLALGAAGVLLLSVSAAGCGLATTSFNPAQSCQAVGGTYTLDGRCHAGLP